jgi:hypothetical protein
MNKNEKGVIELAKVKWVKNIKGSWVAHHLWWVPVCLVNTPTL